jgi:hypothetical protein
VVKYSWRFKCSQVVELNHRYRTSVNRVPRMILDHFLRVGRNGRLPRRRTSPTR